MNRTCLFGLFIAIAFLTFAPASPAADLPIVASEDFEKGADRWEPMDPSGWKADKLDGKGVYAHFKKQTSYKPVHRSPTNFALLKDVYVGDFELTAKVKSTEKEYGHRDACIIFGHQGPAKFYYVHLATKTDDRANQIFIVNNAPRTKISKTTTEGTKWTDDWHTLRVVRTVADGKIAVYYDDMEKPIMTAEDKTFAWGRIGVGSFDDTTTWDEVVLKGTKVEPKK